MKIKREMCKKNYNFAIGNNEWKREKEQSEMCIGQQANKQVDVPFLSFSSSSFFYLKKDTHTHLLLSLPSY